MIRLVDGLWIGERRDEQADLASFGITATLNVAHDLQGLRGWGAGIEASQIGLIDGPGNPPSAYIAAVMALSLLRLRHEVLVYCHTGLRSLAVAIMYLDTLAGRGWDGWLKILEERIGDDLPPTHPAHREAYEKIDWKAVSKLIGR